MSEVCAIAIIIRLEVYCTPVFQDSLLDQPLLIKSEP